jgi:hypothetical protein
MSGGPTRPTPEKLAAYADGELPGPERARIEASLDNCPEALAELESLRKLSCLCRRTTAPEPPADAWDATLARVHAALPAPRSLPWRRPARRPVFPVFTAAAAAVAVVLLGRSFWPAPQVPLRVNPVPGLAGPVDLADSRDVEIISMDGDDTGRLLVGRPPVPEDLVLAGQGDVTLVRMEPFEGAMPAMRQDGAPIIFPPTGDAP